ncbi:MAG TPA: 30S ribosomal protein S5 [Candidatus Azoamicus sp. OHIO1]
MNISSNENVELTQKTDVYLEKLIVVRRNSKVAKGGRVFGFSALTVVGDRNGKVGIGRGKAKEVPFAIQKSMENAKANLVNVVINGSTIYHKILVKYCATKIVMLPASDGTGIIASSVMRSVFEAIGIKNVFAKCFGSKNPNNVVRAMLVGLLRMAENIKASSVRRREISRNSEDV